MVSPMSTSCTTRGSEILRLPSVALGIAMLVGLWWGAFALIGVEQSASRRAIESDTANLARVFEQNVIRSLSEIDKTLLYLRHAHAQAREQATEQSRERTPEQASRGALKTDWSQLIKQAYSASAITFQLAVIDANGRLIATDRGPQPPSPIDLSDREHFRVHAQTTEDAINVSKPVLGRVSKKWSVQITRRLTTPDGGFDGVLVASLDPEHFATFYRAIEIGIGGAITLVGLDGVVRASGGEKASLLGAPLGETALSEAIRRQRSATVHYRERGTGVNRIASTRLVEGYALAVIVATDENQPSGSWKRNPMVILSAAGFLTLLLLTALIAIARRNLRLAETRRELGRKSLQHEVTLENMTQGILMVDGKGEIGFMNARLGELLELPAEFMQGRHSYRDLIDHLERRGEFRGSTIDADLLDFIRFPDDRALIPQYERERPDGTVLEVRSRQLADGGFVRTLTDITGRRRAEAKVLQLACHDPLTGLSNRAVFRQKLEERSRETATGHPFAVLMIDLDRFKPVNDSYGHAVGDLLLKVVAERLVGTVRSSDVTGRIGGDEFAVIQSGASTIEQANALAGRICRALCQPYSIDGQTIVIGASIGIALAPQHGASAQDLLQAADLALYSVKGGNRGGFAVFDQRMNDEHCARRKLEEDIRQALALRQFELHYQPIVSIGSNEATAYEALIRWHHPERGNVPPLDFIPLAEETGLIGPIGAWVLETACNEMAQREGKARIAINLSPVQFRDQNLVEMVVCALRSSGLPASRLEIEITESALLADDALTQRHLDALRDLGVHITMDDFGTGYSSLSYLMSYPIQSLKIDRSFVQGLGDQPNPTAIVRTITTLAASLGLSTTAEGVETARQLELLRELGCTEAQGYLFSRPKPAAEILPPRRVDAPPKRLLKVVG
jgi:diguanylate cyclase (GGDEF)-like protein